jgi:hypothetical protein
MPVTEIALLKLLPDIDISSLLLRACLRKAKTTMEKASGSEFWYYHSIDRPEQIYILGQWPSVDFHMDEFIPSPENLDLLALLKDQITVEWMFHVDIDQGKQQLPQSKNVLAITRYLVPSIGREIFQGVFDANRHHLESLIEDGSEVVGGWKVDKGIGQAWPIESISDEFVLFTAWDNVDQCYDFCSAHGFEEDIQIRDHIVGVETRHAVKLDVD